MFNDFKNNNGINRALSRARQVLTFSITANEPHVLTDDSLVLQNK
jgi:hypothetical protein